MRRRRIERLLARARVAHEEGHEDEARAALDEIEELNGGPIALSPGQESPEIVFCQVADDDLTVFDTEAAVEFDPAPVVPDENYFEDLPLYPHLSSPSDTQRSQWGPRAAAFLAACAVLFWLAGPRESQAPAAEGVEAQSPSVDPSTQSAVAATRQPAAAQPIAEPATTELAPVRLDVTDLSVAARVDRAADGTGPPVSLAGLAFAEPRATSPEPAVRQDAVMAPAAVAPLEQPTPSPLAGVPISSAPTLEAVAPPAAAPTAPPAPPPVESAPVPTPPPAPSPSPEPAREADAPAPAAVAAAGVRATLLRYESAYSRLDVNAAGAVWPALDRKALTRAFDGLASQAVSLGSCEVRIVGESAIADCAGSATWTPKVGGRSHRQARQWQFQLRSVDAGWQIVSATVR